MSAGLDANWQRFSGQINYEGSLQLQVEVLPADYAGSLSGGRMQLNASLLETLLALDKPKRPLLVDEERAEYSGELQLISARLDLVMNLLGRLSPPPPGQYGSVQLNPHGALLDPSLLAATDASPRRVLRLYFDHCPAVALELVGSIDAHHPGFIGFDAMSPEVHDGIERMVFMHHRRQVAAHRGK